jgi:fumarylacetoacetase
MSWVPVSADSDFPIQNLPTGLFSTADNERKRIGVAIGDQVLDLSVLQAAGLFSELSFDSAVLGETSLNSFMELDRSCWRATRALVGALLATGGDDRLSSNEELKAKALVPMSSAIMHLPSRIGDYTDFYSSREHATNVGTMFRGADNALQPNWLHLPVGYHGRSSSVCISGTPVVRPRGQLQIDKAEPKKGSSYGPCRLMDFELEMAFFVGGKTNKVYIHQHHTNQFFSNPNLTPL